MLAAFFDGVVGEADHVEVLRAEPTSTSTSTTEALMVLKSIFWLVAKTRFVIDVERRERSRRGRTAKHKPVRYYTLEILDETGADGNMARLYRCGVATYIGSRWLRLGRLREVMRMIGFVILGIVILIFIFAIGMYNGLVRLKVQTDNAWADIDVQLKRRYDLIPNLVETVKGYAAHEKGTLEAVINARNRAMSASGPADKAEAENMLSGALKNLFALSEAYPQLRAVESFTALQASLTQIEDAVQNARRYYNAVVRDLNTKIQQFPTNIFASMLGFKPREFFEISAPAEREAPKVSFNTPAASA
jgi:LemA protein